VAAIGPAIDMTLAADCGGLSAWRMAFRFLQMREIWAEHGAWIESENPRFGPEIAERFAMSKEAAAKLDSGEAELRRTITRRLDDMLSADGILIIPTAADIAPLKSMSAADSAGFRDRTLSLTCIAGLARRRASCKVPRSACRSSPAMAVTGPCWRWPRGWRRKSASSCRS
jgi:amidase